MVTAAPSTDVAAMEAVGEALAKVEEHLLYRLAVTGIYHKEAEVRGQMLCTGIRSVQGRSRTSTCTGSRDPAGFRWRFTDSRPR